MVHVHVSRHRHPIYFRLLGRIGAELNGGKLILSSLQIKLGDYFGEEGGKLVGSVFVGRWDLSSVKATTTDEMSSHFRMKSFAEYCIANPSFKSIGAKTKRNETKDLYKL